MKNNYFKTKWVDNRTPVNAANLNKIENALVDLYDNALSPSEIIPGNGISIDITKDRELQISVTGDFISSNTCVGFEILVDQGINIEELNKDILYYLLDPITSEILRVALNGVVLFEKKDLSEEESGPVLTSESCSGFEIVNDEDFSVEESINGVLYYTIDSFTGKLSRVIFNKVVIFDTTPIVTSNTCTGFEVYSEDNLPKIKENGRLYFILGVDGKLSRVELNGIVLFEVPTNN